jgi:hypothetical protein
MVFEYDADFDTGPEFTLTETNGGDVKFKSSKLQLYTALTAGSIARAQTTVSWGLSWGIDFDCECVFLFDKSNDVCWKGFGIGNIAQTQIIAIKSGNDDLGEDGKHLYISTDLTAQAPDKWDMGHYYADVWYGIQILSRNGVGYIYLDSGYGYELEAIISSGDMPSGNLDGVAFATYRVEAKPSGWNKFNSFSFYEKEDLFPYSEAIYDSDSAHNAIIGGAYLDREDGFYIGMGQTQGNEENCVYKFTAIG